MIPVQDDQRKSENGQYNSDKGHLKTIESDSQNNYKSIQKVVPAPFEPEADASNVCEIVFKIQITGSR